MDSRNRRRWKQRYRRRYVPEKTSYTRIAQFLKTHYQSIMSCCLLSAMLCLLFGIVSLLPPPAASRPPIGVPVVNYTTFIKQVRAGNVRSVTIQGNQVIGVLAHPLSTNDIVNSPARSPFDFSSSTLSLPVAAPSDLFYTALPTRVNRSLVPLLLSRRVAIQTLSAARPSVLLQLLWNLAPIFVFAVLLYVLIGSSRKNLFSSGTPEQKFSRMMQSHPRRFDDEREKPAVPVTNGQAATSPKASRPSVTFADVAGIDEVRAELEEVVQFLRCPERFGRLGAHIPRGVILAGPPGTGKTLLAKAVAGEASVPFFSMSASEFVEMFVGVGASRVRDLFHQARQSAPCVIFLDEIDAVGRKRSTQIIDQSERDQTLNQLLVELDGFEARCAVVVLAATNRLDMLDLALLRPGRFDRRISVSLPDRAGREAILRVHTRHTPLCESVRLDELAGMTTGMSGAELENLVNEAALCAARRDLDALTRGCFEEALVRVQLGAQRSLVMSETERRIVAFHESGHALVAYHLPGAGIVSHVTILPHGQRLGATQFGQEEDHYNYSRKTLMARLSVGLGGRAAEELAFGPEGITTGAEDDLQTVTRLAWQMVTHWGMSKQLGPIFADRYDATAPFAGAMMPPEPGTRYMSSREMATLIDSEVQSILREAYSTARTLLNEHRDQLTFLARTLMEREHLNRTQFETLLHNDVAVNCSFHSQNLLPLLEV